MHRSVKRCPFALSHQRKEYTLSGYIECRLVKQAASSRNLISIVALPKRLLRSVAADNLPKLFGR